MKYNGLIYRPPIEANTFLLPITEGCTHNSCSFCNMYKEIPFRMWKLEEIEQYLLEVKAQYSHYLSQIDRVYLVGANPFALKADYLLERVDLIKKYIPKVKVITMYARIDNIARKTDEDLRKLKEAGVNDLYIGVESGLDDVLSYLNKGYSTAEIREQELRLNRIGIRHCDLLMLGTAGKERGLEAAKAAAELENEVKPYKILINTMSAFEGTQLDEDIKDGKFTPAGEREIVLEEYEFLKGLDLPETYFWAIHPMDAVGVEGYLHSDKDRMLERLYNSLDQVKDDDYVRVGRRGTL